MKSTSSSVASVASGKGKESIRGLMNFLRLQAQLEANKPTFSKFLGLSAATTDDSKSGNEEIVVRSDRLSFLERSRSCSDGEQPERSLVFRYRLPERLRYLKEDDATINGENIFTGFPSLSTYTSILDEVTTFGVISAAPKHPLPGVSVTLQSQWGPAYYARNFSSLPPKEVDIVTTITKRGRTLAFVRAEVRDPSSDRDSGVICNFDHVKYLPTGWVLSLLMTPVGMWCLNIYTSYISPYLHTSSSMKLPNDSSIMDSFQMTSDATAVFRSTPQHTNGFGGLHGGFQTVLMERLGRSVARKEFSKLNPTPPTCDVECERLQVSYQSSASRQLELRAHVLKPPSAEHPSLTLRIEILRGRKPDSNDENATTSQSKRVVVSEGILTFVRSPPKPKEQ